ncbi:MAG: hypothetical protein WDN00_15255 [Limisphaerales bacterium]
MVARVFPAASSGASWIAKSGKPIYLICNADESEPGTFKDRQIMYKDPHQLIEGMAISCFANDVHLAYIYIRGEMVDGAKILNQALKEARAKGFLGKNILGSGYDLEMHVHRGAGAYICGEENWPHRIARRQTSLSTHQAAIISRRSLVCGCARPIVNNVETLCNVKHIVAMAARNLRSSAQPNNTGTRIVSLSGHVKKPGYYEIENRQSYDWRTHQRTQSSATACWTGAN